METVAHIILDVRALINDINNMEVVADTINSLRIQITDMIWTLKNFDSFELTDRALSQCNHCTAS